METSEEAIALQHLQHIGWSQVSRAKAGLLTIATMGGQSTPKAAARTGSRCKHERARYNAVAHGLLESPASPGW